MTSYYDWSDLREDYRAFLSFPIVPESALKGTLGILDRTVRRRRGRLRLASADVPDAARTAVLRDAIGLGVAVGLYGVAFGAAAAAAGLDAWQALAMSLLMFTGASQFALVGVLGAGGSALAAAGSALLLGTRNTVYGVRLVPLLRPRGRAAPAGHRAVGHRRDDGDGGGRARAAGWPASPSSPPARASTCCGTPRPSSARSARRRWGTPLRRRWTPSSPPPSSPCCGPGCARRSPRRPCSAGSRSAGRSSPWRSRRSCRPGVQVIAAVVAVALAGRPRRAREAAA